MRPILWRGLTVVMATTWLTCCGSTPIPRTFVLGDAAPPAIGVWSEAGLPIVELNTVSLPDYLDSADILRGAGPNEVIASPTGRWGERLSLGLTHALATALSRRLPHLVVTTTPISEPVWRIFVDVQRVDIGAGGQCLLAARWRISQINGRPTPESEHGTFTETAASADDGAVALAMTRAVDHLAERIALKMDQE